MQTGYKCGKILKNGYRCINVKQDDDLFTSGCMEHYGWEEQEQNYLYSDLPEYLRPVSPLSSEVADYVKRIKNIRKRTKKKQYKIDRNMKKKRF